MDNMRAALSSTLTDGVDPLLGARIAACLGRFWYTHGYAVEGSRWLEEAQQRGPDLPLELRARLVYRLGVLLDQMSELSRATELFEQAVELYQELGDQSGVAGALNSLGSAIRNTGEVARARDLFTQSLELRRTVGDRAGQAAPLFNLGSLALDEGDPARAEDLLSEALEIDRSLGYRWGVATELSGLGAAALDQGDLPRAHTLLREALVEFDDIGETDRLAEVLGFLAGLAGAEGDMVRSARLGGAAEGLRDNLGIPLSAPDAARFDVYQEKARASLDPPAFEQARLEGRAMTSEQAVVFALGKSG
jgi:tetratricopeptide (TPR) repeat protein